MAVSRRASRMAGPKDRCAYCGSRSRLTVDHILPQSRGGLDTPDNLQVICLTCNGMKGARTHGEFVDFLDRRYGGIHDGRFTERKNKFKQDKWVDKHILGLG